MENKVSETLDVQFQGEAQQLFMSYGLLTRLSRVMNNADEAINGTLSAELRDQLIVECLRKKGRSGLEGVTEDTDIDDIDMPMEDFEAVIDWAVKHVLGFFMRRMKAAGETMEQLAPEMVDQEGSESSESGLKA